MAWIHLSKLKAEAEARGLTVARGMDGFLNTIRFIFSVLTPGISIQLL